MATELSDARARLVAAANALALKRAAGACASTFKAANVTKALLQRTHCHASHVAGDGRDGAARYRGVEACVT